MWNVALDRYLKLQRTAVTHRHIFVVDQTDPPLTHKKRQLTVLNMRFCEGCQLGSILFPLLLAELEVGSGTEKPKGSVHGILRTLLDVSEDLMEPYFTVRIAVSCGAAGLLDGLWNGRVIVLTHGLLAVCCPLCWGCEGIFFSASCISSLCWQRCFHFFLLK